MWATSTAAVPAAPDLRQRPRDETPVMRYPALEYQADHARSTTLHLARARPGDAAPNSSAHAPDQACALDKPNSISGGLSG